ncbi:MAG: hypothetical protein ABI443_04010 [Chthoniobacterales bacterium]
MKKIKPHLLQYFAGVALMTLFFTGCSRPKLISVSELQIALCDQFQKQWSEKKEPGDSRQIQAVHVDQFISRNGNNFMELVIVWNNMQVYTTASIVPLGTSAIATSFQVPDSKQYLCAIISTQK